MLCNLRSRRYSSLSPRDKLYGANASKESTYCSPSISSYARLPILTTFVPSIPTDSSFRISIHSWDGGPKPSKTLENILHTDDVFAFEARVYIDGIYTSGSLMPPNTSWPYVIEQSVLLDKEGQFTPLRFPAFHQEILHQSHWEAGEMLGRIRIVIAEGVYCPKKRPPFEHVKDVLAFSFQHAPLRKFSEVYKIQVLFLMPP